MGFQGPESRYPQREEKEVKLGKVASVVHDQVKDLPLYPPSLGNVKTPGLLLLLTIVYSLP